MGNSRERRLASRRALRNAVRLAKANGTASYVVGNSPIAFNKVAEKTHRNTCYVPNQWVYQEKARKLSKR